MRAPKPSEWRLGSIERARPRCMVAEEAWLGFGLGLGLGLGHHMEEAW